MTVEITKVRTYKLELNFRIPFKHNTCARKRNETIIIEVHGNNGSVGYGEALPRPYLSGETNGSCWAYLNNLAPEFIGKKLGRYDSPSDWLIPQFNLATQTRQMAAYGALDLAIWDLWSKSFRLSIATGLGWQTRKTPCSLNLGLNLGQKWLPKLLQGRFRDFKLKGSVRAVPQVHPGLLNKTRIDFNGAFASLDHLRTVVPIANYRGCRGFEEPFANPQPEDLQGLVLEGILTIADESLVTTTDADRLLEQNMFQCWNLRLGKNGGFSGTKKLTELARDAGLGINLGVLVGETGILRAAARSVINPQVFQAVESGFDGILLAKDPFLDIRGALFTAKLEPNRGLGLGVKPILSRLKAQTIQSLEW